MAGCYRYRLLSELKMTGSTKSPTLRFVLLSGLFNYVNVAEAAALCGLTLGARLGAVQASSALDPLGPMTPPRARRGSRIRKTDYATRTQGRRKPVGGFTVSMALGIGLMNGPEVHEFANTLISHPSFGAVEYLQQAH